MEQRTRTEAQDTSGNAARAISVCIEVPDSFLNAARYAVRMLLFPLGLVPQWHRREQVESLKPAIYYGADPPTTSAVISLALARHAPAFFEEGTAGLPEATGNVIFRDEAGEPDFVASAFFWLSGWQERSVMARDEHGRFVYAGSMQEQLGTADVPLVDVYREAIEVRLSAVGLPIRRTSWGGRTWALAPTHDVDYIRKWRPGRILREVPRSIMNPRRAGSVLRQVLRGDPFSTSLRTMADAVERLKGHSTLLLKAGGEDVRDVAYRLGDRRLRRFIRSVVADGFEVGLHPSYHASTDARRLTHERDRLAARLTQSPAAVRSHYLRFEFPQTLRLYEHAGFRVDSSLGFPDREGFRFATCHPFKLFDLEGDRESELWEIPLTFMDASLFNRRMYSVDEALDRTSALMETCRRYGGVCVGLWHNVIDDEVDYPGWRRHFQETLTAARDLGAHIGSLAQLLACAEETAQAPSDASIRTTSV